MNILFIGDIYGKPGRELVSDLLPKLRKERNIDFVIANVENLTHGAGITESSLNNISESGVDFFTGGNHIFEKDGEEILAKEKYPLIRPANYPTETVGKGYRIVELKDKKILIINLIGQVFMAGFPECPFRKIDEILEEVKDEEIDFTFVDFHAEATSEKIAMKFYLDSKITALFGTHTHVTTADLHVTDNGTAYISDVGMTGVVDNSVLGVRSDVIISKFLTKMRIKHEVADSGKRVFAGVLIETAKEKYASKAHLIYEHIQ
jgi:metallophosphoesterase (TIGR00282 family)